MIEPAQDDPSLRGAMIEQQLRARGIRDERVLRAMHAVPREAFIAPEFRHLAYADRALPIEEGQTISQPYIVARMIEAAELADGARVLDVGTGSGYAAAVLSELGAQVYSIEREEVLAERARALLRRLGIASVEIRCGDGSIGWPEAAPFDAIMVAASGPRLPAPLLGQLRQGAWLVMPLHRPGVGERLIRVRLGANGQTEEDDLGAVSFVPLIGAEGWADQADFARARLEGRR